MNKSHITIFLSYKTFKYYVESGNIDFKSKFSNFSNIRIIVPEQYIKNYYTENLNNLTDELIHSRESFRMYIQNNFDVEPCRSQHFGISEEVDNEIILLSKLANHKYKFYIEREKFTKIKNSFVIVISDNEEYLKDDLLDMIDGVIDLCNIKKLLK